MVGSQAMRPNQVNTSKLEKQPSKDNTPGPKKNKPLKSQEPKKKGESTKSPTVKRPKEIQYSRLLFIQHYFNGTELKQHLDEKDETQIDPVMDDDDKDAAQNHEEDKSPEEENANQDESNKPANEDEKKQGEDANQIDSSNPRRLDEDEQEIHIKHEGSDNGDVVDVPNPYENDEPLMLEINSKSKSKCLKKVILEKKNLEGSQMLLFK